MSARAYERLFEGLGKRLHLLPDIEITLEANPGSFEQQRFKEYRTTGINRLSIGIQSFNDNHLKTLGRVHDSQQAFSAIDMARNAGFENINLDIMHSLPEQSIEEGLNDIRQAISLNPEHLSWYQLTLEPNTAFYKQRPNLPSEELTDDLEQAGFLLLASQGYQRYEISAFAKDEKYSAHNLNYWRFGDYLGIGAGAHGKISQEKQVIRTRKRRQPNEYLNPQKGFCSAIETVETNDLIFEFMLNLSRLEESVPLSLFQERTGLPLERLLPHLQAASDKGLISIGEDHWQITALGRKFTNDLQALFLIDSVSPSQN